MSIFSKSKNPTKYLGNELKYLKKVLKSESWSATGGSWSKRLEDATGQDDPDEYLKVLGNAAAQGDEESKRELLGLLKQAGPMPKADFDELSNDYGLDDNQKMAFSKLFKVRTPENIQNSTMQDIKRWSQTY